VNQEAAVLSDDMERYVALRTLGAKLHNEQGKLQSFARFAEERGEFHIRAATAIGRPKRRQQVSGAGALAQ
jgi:hypothetical protein